ncbi:Fe2OG dioxygenase domain-containing protein [Madurella fahalii]|uniref:Fe2OG dioxygenase domain-containing protein n=1 Tax=Madurella fahalii TaxID=1157608 RepID=A0ABQ0G0G8_9PEZI
MALPLSHLPPFPEDIPLAPIAVISYRKLLAGDSSEAAQVLEAARTYGFFYLDLQGVPEGEALLTESEQFHALAKDVFSIPLDEKLQYALQRGVSLFGYKPAGTVKTTDKDQRPDTTEFFNISKDHMHGVAPSRSYPPQIGRQRPLLQSFTRHGHECGMAVLRTLAQQLGLQPDEFTRLNLFDRPSGDHCRLTRKTPHSSDAAKAIGLPSHTDFGSVTVLFNWLGGLQIESRTEGRMGEWEWVKPVPGHAIINLGDAMVTFTNGDLKSAKHRVVPSPGEQGSLDRYSVVYFVRPNNDVLMKPLEKFNKDSVVKVAGKFSEGRDGDEALTAGEWVVQRAIQLGN